MKGRTCVFIHPTGKGLLAGLALAALAAPLARATPYAAGVTNNGNGTISFYLNEGGGNVTITYEDSTFAPGYNGTSSGTNLASGKYSFPFAAPHSSYTISVYKVGAGVPTLITSSLAFTPQGVDVNKHPSSPFFGRVYASQAGSGIYVMNPDLSLVFPSGRAAGQSWITGNGFSPYRLYVADDDYLMIGDGSYGTPSHAGVYRADPNVVTSQLFLGPVGESAGLAYGVFGTVQSRPLLIGNPTNGPVTLMQVDGDFPAAGGYNSLLVYTNITLASLPWENPPDIQGPEIGFDLKAETLSGNEYPGLQLGPNGYIYAGTYRENYSNPLLQIYSYDPSLGFNQVWNSLYKGGTADYFRITVGGFTQGTVDIAVSPDGRYVAGVSSDNWFVICPLTNGIPDVSNLFVNTPTSYTGTACGIAFDAADNLYLSGSGLGLVQSWSLGITTTATTTGNASGVTGFQVVFSSTIVQSGPPVITSITDLVSAGVNNVTIQFTSADGDDRPASFALQSSTNAPGPYADVSAATITQLGTGNGTSLFQAAATQANSRRFYRIRHK